jgi:hypothetical protein
VLRVRKQTTGAKGSGCGEQGPVQESSNGEPETKMEDTRQNVPAKHSVHLQHDCVDMTQKLLPKCPLIFVNAFTVVPYPH